MEERPSLSSILKSSVRAPFRGARHQPASEAEGQSNTDASKSPYEKRRQQVRRAQKKHREKKETYVLALEEEVQHLRHALHTSQLQIGGLRNALSSQAVSIPDSAAPWQSSWQPELNMARVALVGAGPKASLQIQGGSNGYGAPLRDSAAMHIPNANPAKQSPHRPMITDDIAYQSTVGYTSSSNAISSPEDQPAGNSTVDYTGLEFVLALEHPCLHHTGHPSISEGMEGHALTLNAAALACAPASIEPSEPWSIPTGSLDRLLETSRTLGLQPGVLTPIQAWDRIRNHPGFPQLASDKLQQLVVRLSKEVKCRGFGAAMNEKAFENMLRELFQ